MLMMFLLGFMSALNLAFAIANFCIEGNLKVAWFNLTMFIVLIVIGVVTA